jgi:hypothetical protein
MAEFTEKEIGQFIVNKEGRRDSQGRLTYYNLPSGDGGGAYEVAGINVKYHPDKARDLKALIVAGKHKEAEEAAVNYVVEFTKAVRGWHPDVRVQCYLRDIAFNRGPTGCAKIFQQALKTAGSYAGEVDGDIGPKTREAAAKHGAEDILLRLLLARQWYERTVAGRNEANKFWPGLVNRWIDAIQLCLSIGDPYAMKS